MMKCTIVSTSARSVVPLHSPRHKRTRRCMLSFRTREEHDLCSILDSVPVYELQTVFKCCDANTKHPKTKRPKTKRPKGQNVFLKTW